MELAGNQVIDHKMGKYTSPQKIIYKYRDWKDPYHKVILLKNQLYLASPSDFNDPFDCRINANFSLLSPKESNEYINELAIKGFPESEKRGLDFANVLKDFEERFNDKENFQSDTDSLLFEAQDDHYTIFSCSLDWDSIPMWSHYANNHKGFCIGFWIDKMMNSQMFGKLGEVKYTDEYPPIKPRVAKKDEQMIRNSFLETHTKARDWDFESEYRFMSNHFPKKLTLHDRIKTIPDEFFAEVILGIEISDEDKDEIVRHCNSKEIPVFQAEKKEFEFKIKRMPIK